MSAKNSNNLADKLAQVDATARSVKARETFFEMVWIIEIFRQLMNSRYCQYQSPLVSKQFTMALPGGVADQYDMQAIL
jgi:hypothetical protein